MNKAKIAISLDSAVLQMVDARVDGDSIRSRSQAIEYLLKQALNDSPLTSAVVLINETDQQILFNKFDGSTLILKQLSFFRKEGLKRVFIITKHTPLVDRLNDFLKKNGFLVNWIFEEQTVGTASALYLAADKINNNFFVMNGDSFIDFDVKKLFGLHISKRKLVTMGLTTTNSPTGFGSVFLEGDLILDFKESKEAGTYIVNAGVYIMRPEVFSILRTCKSLERDFFPKLAKQDQLQGFILPNPLVHFPEK